MGVGIRSVLAAGKIGKALLLSVAPIALVIPGSNAALSQTGAGTVAQGPLFTAIDLNPDGFSESWAYGISGGQQVGMGSGPATGNRTHALLWRGNAADVVDLDPRGFDISWATSISGGKQVGAGRPAGIHALLWHGSAASVVNLQPKAFGRSEATGISGGEQVGWGEFMGEYTPQSHALLWRGSATSVVDLNPRGFDASWAVSISGGEQVGFGDRHLLSLPNHPVKLPNGERHADRHALLWRGSAASVIDLHPPRFTYSWAYGVSGGRQVGVGSNTSWANEHALLWHGSAASVVDLHAFLSPGFVGSSATDVNSSGDIVGGAWGPATDNRNHAFLWRSTRSVVDLHAFLPPGFISSSATRIDSNGDIVGFAAKSDDAPYSSHAFLWKRNVPVRPAPYPPANKDVVR